MPRIEVIVVGSRPLDTNEALPGVAHEACMTSSTSRVLSAIALFIGASAAPLCLVSEHCSFRQRCTGRAHRARRSTARQGSVHVSHCRTAGHSRDRGRARSSNTRTAWPSCRRASWCSPLVRARCGSSARVCSIRNRYPGGPASRWAGKSGAIAAVARLPCRWPCIRTSQQPLGSTSAIRALTMQSRRAVTAIARAVPKRRASSPT